MNSNHYRLGLVLVTTSAIAWSTAGFFTRILPLDSMTMLAWRGVFGALGMLALGVTLEGRRFWLGLGAFVRRDGWPAWAFAACTIGGMICYITALRATSVAHVAVVYASVPFVAAALGWFFLSERPSPKAIAASLAALLGIAVMVGFSLEGGAVGDLLAFGMTVTMALSMVLTRRYQGIPFISSATISSLASGLLCLPFGHPWHVTGDQILVLAAFGIVNSAIGFGLFTLGARLLPAVETALIGSLDAPLSPLWVWLVFAETPGAATIIGGLIVFAAVAIYLIASSRSTAVPSTIVPIAETP